MKKPANGSIEYLWKKEKRKKKKRKKDKKIGRCRKHQGSRQI